ncbi:AraC family transcriptional regulator [Fodinicola feengrottensis]|uniref:AraC family transcriptional regulator n=1 Tax=Fodinicola feengrottensis TaxID=435914 RepID=A0ABN2G8R2_9ACTN
MDLIGDVLASMRSGAPLSSRCRLQAPWGMRFAPVMGVGFHVLLQGSAWLVPPGGGDPLRLQVGDIVFVSHGRGHALVDSPGAIEYEVPPDAQGDVPEDLAIPNGSGAPTTLLCGSYIFGDRRPHPLITALPEVIHLPARIGPDPAIRSVVDLLGAELADRGAGSSAAVPALLDLLLLYVLRGWFEQQARTGAGGWAAALNDLSIRNALQHIQNEPAEPWTVATLADRAGMSRATFARRFSSLLGESPLGYLTWWRMTRAGQLLTLTDDSMAAIASQVGYQSEFAFGKAFKREFAVAPGAYRRQRRTPGR